MISAHADLEQDLLAVCRRFRDRSQYLEVRVEEAASTDFAFQGHELETLNRREERGGDVRALVDGAWGFTSFNRLDQLDEMAAAAVDQAKLAGGGPVKLAPADPVQDRVLLPESAQAEEQTLADKVARLRALNELILGFGAPITTSTAYYADRRARIWLGTSEGTAIHQERLDVTAALVATAAAEGRVQSRSFSTGSSADASLPELDEEQAVSVCRECAGLFRAPKPKAGDYLVVGLSGNDLLPNFADHPGRLQMGQPGQVDRGLRVSGPLQHAAVLRSKREHVPRHPQVLGPGGGVARRAPL